MNPFDESKRRDDLKELERKTNYFKDCIPFKNDFIDLNTINLNQTDFIYRFFNLDNFLKTLNERKLCLVRPHLWEDPYENYISNGIGQLRDGRKVNLPDIKNNFYAQCWTIKSECDGLWRNYRCSQKTSTITPSNIAIKVKSTVRQLMDQFYDLTFAKLHYNSYFIGKVNYIPALAYENLYREGISLTDFETGMDCITHLLTKRDAFKYEEEVRIIFYKLNIEERYSKDVRNKWDSTDYFFVNFEPNNLFIEIEIDPWVNENKFDDISKMISNCGYKGKINNSHLYSKPSAFIIPLKDWY